MMKVSRVFKTLGLSIVIMAIIFSITVFGSTNTVSVTENVYGNTSGDNLVDIGLVAGNDGNLNENGFITRAELMTLVARLYRGTPQYISFKPPTTATFKDVNTKHWAYWNVEFCAKMKIVAIPKDLLFRPDDKANYNQVALILARTVGANYNAIEYKKAAFQAEDFGIKVRSQLIDGINNARRGFVFELFESAILAPIGGKMFLDQMLFDNKLKESFVNKFDKTDKYVDPDTITELLKPSTIDNLATIRETFYAIINEDSAVRLSLSDIVPLLKSMKVTNIRFELDEEVRYGMVDLSGAKTGVVKMTYANSLKDLPTSYAYTYDYEIDTMEKVSFNGKKYLSLAYRTSSDNIDYMMIDITSLNAPKLYAVAEAYIGFAVPIN